MDKGFAQNNQCLGLIYSNLERVLKAIVQVFHDGEGADSVQVD